MKKLPGLIILLLFFGTLIFGFHYALFFFIRQQGGFKVRSITVTGLRYVSQDEIIRLSGLRKVGTILDVDLLDTAVNISKSPLVDYAVVRRNPPDEILIDVKEIEAVARVFFKNREVLLTGKGDIISQRITKSLPLIRLDYPLQVDGDKVSDAVVLLLLNRLSKYSGADKISSLILKKKEGFYVIFSALPDTLFYLGSSFGDSLVLKRAEGIVEQIRRRGLKLKYVDVNSDNAIGVVD